MNLTRMRCAGANFTLALLLMLIMTVGCSGATPPSLLYVDDTEYRQTWFPFLEDGKTTKSEVESKLGKPPRQFEDGRIWTYEMTGLWTVYGLWVFYENPEYNLVLVFDENNLLRKQSLVRIRHRYMSGF
jgi:hypothetical protein